MNFLRKIFLLATAMFAFSMLFAQMAEPVKWKFSTEKISDKEYNLVMTATVILCFLASTMYFAVALFEKLMNKLYQ